MSMKDYVVTSLKDIPYRKVWLRVQMAKVVGDAARSVAEIAAAHGVVTQ
ncbi:hypothetical protein [Mycobacterium haemophilum]|nr:hypothetical protein [Mycobacterium haemophilum]MCV7340173.1 hypothetical protein [Mycobacterium haemophilum DSM 44634]